MQVFIWMICFLSSLRTVKACCQTTSYSSKTAHRWHRPIRLVSLKNESRSIARSSLRRVNDHKTPLTWILSITTFGILCVSGTKCLLKSQSIMLNSRLLDAILKILPQEAIDFPKKLQTCIRAHGGYVDTYSKRIGRINKRFSFRPKINPKINKSCWISLVNLIF